jgi:hypothetical protein
MAAVEGHQTRNTRRPKVFEFTIANEADHDDE